MNWQTVFNLMVAVLTIATTVYGIRSGKKGKDADRRQAELAAKAETERQARAAQAEAEQQDRAQRFAEIVRSLEEARADLTYYKTALADARKAEADLDHKIDAINAEWRRRHLVLLERCQDMSDVVKSLLETSKNLTPEERQRIRAALGRVRQHIDHDHDQIDDQGHIEPSTQPRDGPLP